MFRYIRCVAIALLATTTSALASSYPNKPVNVVVPWGPSGIIDITARAIANQVGDGLGQPMIVLNKPGAGGMLGANLVANAEPDGYTLLLINSSLNMNAALGQKLGFDASRGFEPILVVATAPMILIAKPSLGVRSVKELVALARSKNGQLSYGTAGVGTPSHFAGEMFCARTGVIAAHIPYKGAAASITDQVAGRIDFQFANAAVAVPQIKAGTVVPLAVTSPKGLSLLPDIPTMADAGYPEIVVDQWIGYLAPAGTPRPVVDRLAGAIRGALAEPRVQQTLRARGMEVDGSGTPESFGSLMKADLALWRSVVAQTKMKLE